MLAGAKWKDLESIKFVARHKSTLEHTDGLIVLSHFQNGGVLQISHSTTTARALLHFAIAKAKDFVSLCVEPIRVIEFVDKL